MGGGDIERKKKPDVIIPELGAAKYWYVDPRAQQSSSSGMKAFQNLTDVMADKTVPQDGVTDVIEALSRIGVSDAKQPSF